jgi:tRNA 2-thiouridine synthesizing protein A
VQFLPEYQATIKPVFKVLLMYILDARGRVCPLPLFYTKKKIDELKTGEELEVLTDDVTARNTIPQWSREHGHEIVKVEESGSDFRVIIRKH